MAWNDLSHPNVLLLLGATMDGKQLVMVSKWMEHGNVNEFTKANPDADRVELVGFSPNC